MHYEVRQARLATIDSTVFARIGVMRLATAVSDDTGRSG